jgi:adenosylmethionine-8-amino-7-oxononanoate aminotransferase
VSEFNYRKNRLEGETLLEYSSRLVTEFENTIYELGPENIGGFVAETIMGGLVGDVPATKEYWEGIRQLCSKHNVHLIIDEVWCGTGVSGKLNCIEWYGIEPDLMIVGKTLGAGYIPISAVMTTSCVANTIANNSGRFETSCTFQGHSLACAAALAVQKIIRSPGFVDGVCQKGEYIRSTIESELRDHEFFEDVRGLGVRNSIEYKCPEQNLFGQYVAKMVKEKHNILISGKWHRISLSHAMTFSYSEIDQVLNAIFCEFKSVGNQWTRAFYDRLVSADFF